MQRFISNLQLERTSRVFGTQQVWWIKRTQQHPVNADDYHADKLQLNLQRNDEGLQECRGRIVGQYPIYLPDSAPFTKALVHEAHLHTLHGGVVLNLPWLGFAKPSGFQGYEIRSNKSVRIAGVAREFKLQLMQTHRQGSCQRAESRENVHTKQSESISLGRLSTQLKVQPKERVTYVYSPAV